MLATYDHPTPFSLVLLRLRAGRGGLHSGGEAWKVYTWLVLWLGFLGLGYGMALAYLAEVLGVRGKVVSRLETAIAHGLDEPVVRVRTLSTLGCDERLGDA